MNDETVMIPEEVSEIEETSCLTEDTSEAEAENHLSDAEQIEAAPEENIELLRQQIADLKSQISELETMRDTQTRVLEELADFRDLFPEVEINAIPESVWDSVKKGTPLIASYALYEKRMEAERARISLINAKNASKSAGIAGKNTASEYFSPDEVRKMSRAEVHANYSKIKESMKKWM